MPEGIPSSPKSKPDPDAARAAKRPEPPGEPEIQLVPSDPDPIFDAPSPPKPKVASSASAPTKAKAQTPTTGKTALPPPGVSKAKAGPPPQPQSDSSPDPEPFTLDLPLVGDDQKGDLEVTEAPPISKTPATSVFHKRLGTNRENAAQAAESFVVAPFNLLLLGCLGLMNLVLSYIDFKDIPLAKDAARNVGPAAAPFEIIIVLLGVLVQLGVVYSISRGLFRLFGRSSTVGNIAMILLIGLAATRRVMVHYEFDAEKEKVRVANVAAEDQEKAKADAQKSRPAEQDDQAARRNAPPPTPQPAPARTAIVMVKPEPVPPPQAPPPAPLDDSNKSSVAAPEPVVQKPVTAVNSNPLDEEFPELNIPMPEESDSSEEASIDRAKIQFINQLKPLLKEYKEKAEAFRDTGGITIGNLTSESVDARVAALADMKAAYEPYNKLVILMPNFMRLELGKSNINLAKTNKAIGEVTQLLESAKYAPSKSPDLATINRLGIILDQIKKLPAGWKTSEDGLSIVDKSGKSQDQLNEYMANTRKKMEGSGILKLAE